MYLVCELPPIYFPIANGNRILKRALSRMPIKYCKLSLSESGAGASTCTMAIRVVEFSSGVYKIRNELLNLEFWIIGELSKIGHHFINKVIKN